MRIRTGENRVCLFCGKEFYAPNWLIKIGKGKFCSKECYGKNEKGRKLLEKTKMKMSEKRKGSKHWNWKGGKYLNWAGYVLVYMPNHPFADYRKRVREHRLEMEKDLSRLLQRKEVVHHIDGNVQNNNINNLLLFPNQREHLRFEAISGKVRKQNYARFCG